MSICVIQICTLEKRNSNLDCINNELFDDNYKKLHELFNKDCIAILLGAGSSIKAYKNCDMPNWENLLQLLQKSVNGFDAGHIPPSQYLQTAGLIENEVRKKNRNFWRKYLSKQGQVFPEHVFEALLQPGVAYQVSEFVRRILKKRVSDVKISNLYPDSTLSHIVEACFRRFSNGKSTIIITYNFDDLFEYTIRELHPEIEVHSHTYKVIDDDMLSAGQTLVSGKTKPTIDIFYVHGKIPLLTESSALNGIILSQQSYDVLFRNYMTFTNMIQNLILSSVPTISVGFSCDDENFRRLRTDMTSISRKLPILCSIRYCDEATCPCKNQNKENEMQRISELLDYYNVITLPLTKAEMGKTLKYIL